jgi:hopanoid biosynthesis associated RND transporter like protein HpnN
MLGLLTLVFGWIAVDRFRINSNLSDLIEQDAPWRQDFDRYEAAFPDLVRTTVVVVSGYSYKGVEDAAKALEAELKSQEDFFRAVYAPQNDDFFREHALLFLDHEELDDMVDRIASAQPMLTAVAEDPSLRGILELLEDGIDNDPPEGFDTIVRILADSGASLLAGGDPDVSWTDEFFQPEGKLHRLIFLKGQENFGAALPTAEIMARVRSTVANVPVAQGVSVAITGEIALQHEEIEAAVGGVQLAGWLSILLLVLILVVGVRSLKIISATFLMLFVGIVWTSAYAMLAVGEYNTLSIIFLVMFFGLGVDFAIHYSLRYQEAVNAGDGDIVEALDHATRSVGGAIATCTATTSIGFLGFLPTPYQGLADLGVISAGGMLVAAGLTFTLLPAFYSVVGHIRPHTIDLPTGDRLVAMLLRRRRYVIAVLAVAAAVAGTFAVRIYFDYSVLALKDEQSESMRALRELQDEGVATDYSLMVLSDVELADDLLDAVPTVDSVTTPWDYVPKDQEDKLYVLEDLQQILWSALEPARTREPPTAEDLGQQLTRLAAVMGSAEELSADPDLGRLRDVVSGMRQRPPDQLLVWQEEVIANLLFELSWLRSALAKGPVEFADLPAALKRRLVSADGQYLSIVTPTGDVASVEVLSEFVTGVRQQVPVATGRPVIEWGVGQIVVGSFQQALTFATVGILLVLILVFRNLRDAIMILIPLALTCVFTLAVSVLAGLSLNMANILVLPLIFGLGVDNGIHVVDRFHRGGDVDHFMHSSTPRAVMLSTLTTIGAFAALSLSPHQGTASVGILLAIAVALLLVFTVFLLPVLLSLLITPDKA